MLISFSSPHCFAVYGEVGQALAFDDAGGGDAALNEGRREKKIYGMFPVFVRMVLLKER